MNATAPIITLLTDFGNSDGYVAAMKGVLAIHAPAARVVDADHALPAHDVRAAAVALDRYWPFFPGGTIHLAVIDPGVGTRRRALMVRLQAGLFLAPDNGLLSWLIQRPGAECLMLRPALRRPGPRTMTFDGRDVFAYAAALLAHGRAPEDIADPCPDPEVGDWASPRPEPGGGLCGEVLGFDRFGNAITNLRVPDQSGLAVEAGGRSFDRLSATYADVEPGAPLALVGSSGLVEIAIREGSAREVLGLRAGYPVHLAPRD